jgi:hypothetical protein
MVDKADVSLGTDLALIPQGLVAGVQAAVVQAKLLDLVLQTVIVDPQL